VIDENIHQQLFFHVSEVLYPKPQHSAQVKPDLRLLFKVGDEIEFVIEPSRTNDGRLHAKQVKKLKPGTVVSEEVESDVASSRCVVVIRRLAKYTQILLGPVSFEFSGC
jgi:hypothetical protein